MGSYIRFSGTPTSGKGHAERPAGSGRLGPSPGKSVLLRGLEIVDVDKGQVLHRRGLLIQDGRIKDYMKPLPPSLARRWGDHVLVVQTPAEAREAVKRNHELGCCFIKKALDNRALFVGHKPLPTLDDHSMAAVVEQAHYLGLKVSAHHRFRCSTRHFTVRDGIPRVPGKSPSTGGRRHG